MENLINFISNGYGYGYGDGNGYSSGDGNGYSNGYGYGYGDGNGYSNSYGYGIKKINGMDVVKIDNIPTAIKKIRGNIAFGYVFEKMQLKPCYVVKQDGLFAHGKTVKEAFAALQEKLFDNMTTDERINAFLKEIKSNTEYPAKTFYDWHHRLTGSCEFGRSQFIENHNIKLDQLMTVRDFIELTKNDYGGEIIKELEKRLNKSK
nr:MAG TPA: hypothetical protein [Caudoviricetes sp.]